MASYSYSLAAKFLSELAGMTLTIFIGESILANELLPSTKGHAMGLLGVSIGFGFAFGVNIAWFGAISAHLNPAMFLFLALTNKLEEGWTEFVVCAIADFIGAFMGAVLVYLQFSPHFWTVPLPADNDPVSLLLHGNPDGLGTVAGRIASAFGSNSKPEQGITLKQEAMQTKKIVRGKDWNPNSTAGNSQEERKRLLLAKMIMKHETRSRAGHNHADFYTSTATSNNLRRRRSVQVADLLHQHDDSNGIRPENSKDVEGVNASRHSVQVAGLLHTHDKELGLEMDAEENEFQEGDSKPSNDSIPNEADDDKKRHDDTYAAAMAADARAKLSIFCTRPAKYNRVANFYQEATATAILVLGAELINLRSEFDVAANNDGPFTRAMLVSFFIMALILGLGGTTGLAVNPARDFGPRLAHALLPIPGKGDSEWHYAWVPLLAPFCGAALGAALFFGFEALYESGSKDETVG